MSMFGFNEDVPEEPKYKIIPDNEPEAEEYDKTPLVSFGVISDVKYSCKNNYVKRRGPEAINCYPESSLDQVNQALNDWNQSPDPVSFLINLGNLTEEVDDPKYDRDSSLVLVLNTLEKFPRPKYHILGPHELEQFTRRELHHSKLHSAVNAPGAVPANHDKFYFHFSPTPGVRIIIVDLYELGLIGYQDDPDCQEITRAKSLMSRKNTNANPKDSNGLSWQDARFTSLNGGTSNIQLQWLVEVLDYSEKAREIVIVCGHNPLCASDKKKFSRVCWNNEDILQVLQRFPCVVAYICGNDPSGGYLQDSYGIHHLSLPGVCETHDSTNSYGTVHVYRDRLEVVGGGKVPDMNLQHHGQAQVVTKIPKAVPHPSPQLPAPAPVEPQPFPVPAPSACPPIEMPPPAQPIVLPPVQFPAQSLQMPQLPPAPMLPPPTLIPAPQPQPTMVPVMIRQPMVTKIIKRTVTKKDIGHPPPIIAASMDRMAAGVTPIGVTQVRGGTNGGVVRKVTPVTVAVPIEKLNAMGGVQNFQLAEVPKGLVKNGKINLSNIGGVKRIVKAK